MGTKLRKEIIDFFLKRKLAKNEAVLRTRIGQIRRGNLGLTINAAAHHYAESKGTSVLKYLEPEDRLSLASVQRSASTPRGSSHPAKPSKKQTEKIVNFFKHNPSDLFQKRHIEEVNRAYTYRCYTAAFILCRKIFENMAIDLLIKRFPPSGGRANKELYFNIGQNRLQDFKIILDNLEDKKGNFPVPAPKAIEALVPKLRNFAKDANNKTHSWFHGSTKAELDNIDVDGILALITLVDKTI